MSPALIVCVWCHKIMRPGSRLINHGVCAECEARYMGDIDTKKATT